MIFWFLIAALTVAAIVAVLLPLSSGSKAGEAMPPAATDMGVYRQQLDELADDEAQGRIDRAEAKVARAEIARRLIAAERSAKAVKTKAGDSQLRRRVAAIFGLVAVPAFALSLYFVTGAPDLPGQPLAARIAEASEAGGIGELVAKVEGYLESNPEDGRAWELLAPVYVRLGRSAEAVVAMRNAIRILGSTTDRQADLGEVIIMTQGGIVTADARKAFQAAIEHDATAPKARFFLALAKKQDGDAAGAAQDWRALLADTPADAPYRQSIELALADDEPQSGSPSPPLPPSQPGPTSEDVANAQSLSSGEQQAMIDGMVSRLAERLASEPDDAEGWLRLVRAYAVLGRQEDAEQAATTAIKSVSESAGRARIASLAAELGIALEEVNRP